MVGRGGVVVADGDGVARTALAAALARAGHEVIEAASGAEALDALENQQIALMILEVELPDTSGYELCSALREDGRDRPAIFLLSGTRTDPLDRIAGLLLGADDFIVKPFDTNEVVVRAGRFLGRAARSGRRSAHPSLTSREREVLALVADGMGQKQIAERLQISQKTVATHIQNLLVKLGVHSRAELVARAYQIGLVVANA